MTLQEEVFPVCFDDVRDFINHLRESDKGHSVLCGVVEMVNFLRFVLGVDVESTALNSVWIRGALRKSLQDRPRRKQSRVLTVNELRFLEEFLHDQSRNPTDRYAAGCFYSSHTVVLE